MPLYKASCSGSEIQFECNTERVYDEAVARFALIFPGAEIRRSRVHIERISIATRPHTAVYFTVICRVNGEHKIVQINEYPHVDIKFRIRDRLLLGRDFDLTKLEIVAVFLGHQQSLWDGERINYA